MRFTHFVLSEKASDELRIVLLGKTGVGKSATGNTILGREAFKEDVSHDLVTRECQRETAEIDDRHITLIDTPGLFDTKHSHEEIQREITDCISMIFPGPHVFLLLIPVGRFTQEEENTVKIIQETFGENSLMFTMVLFTRGDDLKKKTIEEFLGKPDSALMKLTEQCGNRYHVFNNNETGDRVQVSELMKKINDMVTANGGSYYTCKMFRQMEREKQEAQMKMMMDEVEELKREREELLAKHEEEKEKMKMKMEEERHQFKKSEEQYKIDMKRKQEEWEKKIQEERLREEDEKRRKKEQQIRERCDTNDEREKINREKERIECEKDLQAKHDAEIKIMKKKIKHQEILEEKIQHEKSLREETCKIFEDKIKLIEQKQQDEQIRAKPVDCEEDRRKDIENMKMCCSRTTSSLQVIRLINSNKGQGNLADV